MGMIRKKISETMEYLAKWFLSSFFPFVLFQLCSSIDTLTPSHSIKDGDLLVSDGENFALGFFSPGNSSNRYVGVWYNKVSEQTNVWVANRDSPINDTSGVLSINQDGNLVIYGRNQNVPLWSTNVSMAVMNTNTNTAYTAQLLDSGNLQVLFQTDDTTSVVVWQSFDHPTNTMLPNMQLGLDRRSGLNRFLTSWKSRDDPGIGEYSYRIDPRGSPEFYLYKDRGGLELVPLWRAGPWIANKWNGRTDFIFNLSYVDDHDEVILIYNSPILSRVVINESGYIERIAWQEEDRRWNALGSIPMDHCDNYGHCGVNGNCDQSKRGEFECTCLPGFEPKSSREWYMRDGSNGCGRKHVPNATSTCGNGEGFVKVASTKLPDTSTARVDTNLSMKACRNECLNNCSCMGYARGEEGNCIKWHGAMMDTRLLSYMGLGM